MKYVAKQFRNWKPKSGWRSPALREPAAADPQRVALARAYAYQAHMLGREVGHVSSVTWDDERKALRKWIDENMTEELHERLECQQDRMLAAYHVSAAAVHAALVRRGWQQVMSSWSGPSYYDPYGQVHSSGSHARQGYFTDGVRYAYVGEEPARGWEARQLKPIQIVVAAGRLLDATGADALLDDALGEQLELAA